MNWVTGILVYVVVWWVVLFTVLPFGIRPSRDPLPGTTPSAPERPRMRLKVAVTSVIAAVMWLAIDYVVITDLFGFRDYVSGQ